MAVCRVAGNKDSSLTILIRQYAVQYPVADLENLHLELGNLDQRPDPVDEGGFVVSSLVLQVKADVEHPLLTVPAPGRPGWDH